MSTTLQIGTAQAIPGQITYGIFEGVSLPTGGTDAFPIIIATGKEEGPVFWITGSIHGNEYSGMAVIHRLLGPGGAAFPLELLRGTVVMIPTLNPAGLRTESRAPYYNRGADPNRMFPAPKRPSAKHDASEDSSPPALELAYARLFEHMEAHCDFLIDLHNAVIGSIAFVFRDPIYYDGPQDRLAVQALMERNDDMMAAFGMPVINEFPSDEYLKKNLHRSVSGSVLNRARKPAFTVELGSYLHVDTLKRDAAVVGLRNVMRWAGMLPGEREPMPPIPYPKVDFPVRRMMHPRAPYSGIVTHLVDAGDIIRKGQPVARITDIYGRPLGPNEGLLLSDHDGYVVGRMQGNVYYENEPVLWLAIRDSNGLILPYPRDY
ncbi:MAG: M14 family metallopeptidase [Anaerolineae bacterium]